MRHSWLSFAIGVLLVAPTIRAQGDMHEPLDRILDTYVRDGYVYYRALKAERAPLDRYIASLEVPRARVDGWSRDDQKAFWINAYNALVLRTVINAYPIAGRSTEYPSGSIRQIPGAFDAGRHRVAEEALTLDALESQIVARFGDARALLALGRGAIGSPRLRSEAYVGSRLDEQLDNLAKECAARVNCVKVDRAGNVLEVTPLVSWREAAFVASFAPLAGQRWPARSPVERAVAAMVFPHLFASEQAWLEADGFRMQYGEFDWRLNDLTGGQPE
jgi:hypothetical protein